jgi:hypothetical protein
VFLDRGDAGQLVAVGIGCPIVIIDLTSAGIRQ